MTKGDASRMGVVVMVMCRHGVVMAGVMLMICMMMGAAGVWIGVGLGKNVLMGMRMNVGMAVYVAI